MADQRMKKTEDGIVLTTTYNFDWSDPPDDVFKIEGKEKVTELRDLCNEWLGVKK